jgi:ribosomal peptide maturation radical SAM protein 1
VTDTRDDGDQTRTSKRKPLVSLICMPWATTMRPSLALGILSRLCDRERVPVRTLYPNMDLTATVGFHVAGRFANDRALFGLSEHLFACDIYGRDVLASDEYLAAMAGIGLPEPLDDPGYLVWLRDEVVGPFLDAIEQRILGLNPSVVGFTATFNQVMASLALGRRLKRRDPELQVLLGGACVDGEMGEEYHRLLPEAVDHVFLGEAEVGFTEYLRRHVAGAGTCGVPGTTWYQGGTVQVSPGQRLQDMNDAPVPDFDAFFVEAERMRSTTGHIFNIEYLPFESSRGCWWGEKSHCVFCGINDDLMAFREKSVDRVIHEMVWLAHRYRVVKLTAADWIVSKRSRDELFRRLADLDLDMECFYETRADMKKHELALMRDAGVVSVQPGIESMSTELLKLMQKSTTRIRHVQFLRWCREYGIHLSYNILAGFPGERPEWYLEMAEFLPRIIHLQPPLYNAHFVEMHRFSPLHERREMFGVQEYRIREDYAFNFPLDHADLRKVGYFFDYSSSSLADRADYIDELRAAIAPWIERHQKPDPPRYTYRLGPSFAQITDTRHGDGRVIKLADLHHDVFLLCDRIQSVASLRRLLAAKWPAEVGNGQVDEVVEHLLDRDVLMREGASVLALPVGHRPRTTEQLYSYVLGPEAAAEDDQDSGARAGRPREVLLASTVPVGAPP